MARAETCRKCSNIDRCKETRYYCSAMNDLFHLYSAGKKTMAADFVAEYRHLLSQEDAEISPAYEELAEKVIDAVSELHFIRELEIKVGYVLSYERKIKKGHLIYADCRKVDVVYQCYIPYDFLITVYEPNIQDFTREQLQVLMWHELKHIGINERTLQLTYQLMPHEVEDFHSILDRMGTRWSEPGANIEDILESVV